MSEFYGREEPAYALLAAHLRQQIESGQLQPGDQVPSVATMVRTMGVYREVAEGALAELKRQGWTVAYRGQGTRVRRRPEARVVDMSVPDPEVQAEVARLGAEGHPIDDVFETVTPKIPTPEEVERLGVPAGLPVAVRMREYVAGGVVVERRESVERGESSAFRYRLPLE